MHWNNEITGRELRKTMSAVRRETVTKLSTVWVENDLRVLLSCIVVVGGLNSPEKRLKWHKKHLQKLNLQPGHALVEGVRVAVIWSTCSRFSRALNIYNPNDKNAHDSARLFLLRYNFIYQMVFVYAFVGLSSF